MELFSQRNRRPLVVLLNSIQDRFCTALNISPFSSVAALVLVLPQSYDNVKNCLTWQRTCMEPEKYGIYHWDSGTVCAGCHFWGVMPNTRAHLHILCRIFRFPFFGNKGFKPCATFLVARLRIVIRTMTSRATFRSSKFELLAHCDIDTTLTPARGCRDWCSWHRNSWSTR